MAEPILLAQRGSTECHLLPALANRHGLITGATGTGKTVTLQVLCERFSTIGVPVFVADVNDLPASLADFIQDGDVVLTMGAGSIGQVPARLAALGVNHGGNP